MPQAHSPTQQTRRDELPLAGRFMELRSFTRAASDAAASGDERAPLATARLVISAGASVRRYDWYREREYLEQLVVEEGAIRLDRLTRGAPLLNTHSRWSLEDMLGVADNPTVVDGRCECDATFSRRESVAGYVQDVEDGVIRSVSVGYVRHRIEMVPPEADGGLWTYRVVDWEPFEVSLVPIPADMDSQVVRSAGGAPDAPEREQQLRTFPCEFVETRAQPMAGSAAINTTREDHMPGETQAGGQPADQTTRGATAAPAPAATPAAPAAPAADPVAAAAERAADITDLCARHGVAHLAAGLIRSGNSVEQARGAVLDELARRDAAAGGHHNTRVETVSDEAQTRMAGVQEALLHRVDPRAELTDNGRQYRGMSLLEIGRDLLEARGVNTRGMDRMTLAARMLSTRGMHGTSDFSHLLSGVAGRRLRSAYDENPGTYGIWARRAPNAPDFKDITVVQLSGAPELLQTNEHGEFKYGTMRDGAETYKVLTYGRIVALSRQAIVNDDLRGFDRLVGAFGASSRRLENRLVYAQLTGNPKLSDNVDLFHADHGNLGTGAGSALGLDGLGAARAAMRKQTGLQGELLNLVPAYLIVPAAHEQKAYQFTSASYVPAEASKINEFRAGGRTALEPVVEPLLDASSSAYWYLAAANSQVDTVEYCYLDGAEGPVIEEEMGFEVDGVSLKCRLDFAAKVVDYRGLYRSNNS